MGRSVTTLYRLPLYKLTTSYLLSWDRHLDYFLFGVIMNNAAVKCVFLLLFFGGGGLFGYSKAAPAAYGGSQASGLIGAVAAGLCHSHSNAGSLTH